MYMNKNTILQLYFLLKYIKKKQKVDKTDKFKMRSFHFKFNFPKFPQKKLFGYFVFFDRHNMIAKQRAK